ncbi:unnamed protein product [Kuraishia capsulata CBS 1993]|uniref:Uncharacterized protein n=1 Tax=Kuraishia capsulata CBS 1993 TaxID=1382522 RepID=W6MMI3_9ASCO|nr:uncharacterized protein KUCA_T00003783001 [Kuraishia capsulata CBS 1993]CDK27804.1 unnamed protein product [Kuraishia capsulata CBS 1993]
MADHENEAEVVGRALIAIVDIGSNGIRFSISSKAPHHARIMPCVFKDRIGISLFDVQLPDSASSTARRPIPEDAILEICRAMKRFKLICEDFGVPPEGVRVVATEATREAANSKEFRDAIYQKTGWHVDLLSKEDEGKCGAFGVASSFHRVSGLFMDLGGGSTQLSWISSVNGVVKMSELQVSLPYGAAALTHRLKFEDRKDVYNEIKQAYELALERINIPQHLIEEAEANGGFDLYTCGGGFRGLGHLLLSQDQGYPIQTIINGYSTNVEQVRSVVDYLVLKKEVPRINGNEKIFRVSARRQQQLPAVGLLVSAALESLPKIRTVHFSEGGVREGVLYSIYSNAIRSEDPLLTASRPYAPLLSNNYYELLKAGLPPGVVPDEVLNSVAPALCNLAFVHCSYPKELQPTAALHVATTGIIAGSHGLSHKVRALISIATCERWGCDIPPSQETFYAQLEKLVMQSDARNGERLLYWTKYCGKIMHVICGIHPGGNIRPGSLLFQVRANNSTAEVAGTTAEDPTSKYDVLVLLSPNDVKSSYSVRSRIFSLQKKIKKLNNSYSGTDKVTVNVQYSGHPEE